MDWGRDPRYGEITPAELPLALREAISRYEPLKNYAAFPIGVGIDYGLYNSDEVYRHIVNENFDEITFANEMKHRWMVKANGELDFATLDPMVEQARQAGLKIYGHTLVWHSNQNASYLNSLIAPTIVPSPGGSLLDVSGLLDGSFSGWCRCNNPSGISVAQNEGLNNGPAIRFETATDGNEYSTQLISPEINAVPGHEYEVSIWIRSENSGNGRLSFSGMSNNYPWVNGASLFNSSGTWTQVKYNTTTIGSSWTASGDKIKVQFDLGKTAGVYYVDINSISVIDLDAPAMEHNFVANGGFEAGGLGNWIVQNAGAGVSVSNEQAHTGTYSLKMKAGNPSSNPYDLQVRSPELTLTAGKDYTLSFYIKSDVAGQARVAFPGLSNEWPYKDWKRTGGAWTAFFTTGTEWEFISVDLDDLAYKEGESTFRLSFEAGYLPDVTYYIDDVKLVEKNPSGGGGGAPLIIEKTPEEKKQIIEEAMESFVTGMVSRYKGKVDAWDVVNEAINEAGGLRNGQNVTDMPDDHFCWQDYIGEDFAVKAFQWAKQADPEAKMFINDYNLEAGSLAKLDGLIQYVQYIESQGAQVDGIGTQMHISIDSDKNNIEAMFQKLGATGKLVKVTELDITVGTNSPTLEQYAQQADMYRYVVDMYRKHVPEAQQYGITVWSVSDHPREHEFWLPDDAPNLWDANYQRKHAYKGFADGLAGKDVSADFSGELQY